MAIIDNASLQELGVNSVGHRLTLLRAVWELKKEQGIALNEDDWKPQGMHHSYLYDLCDRTLTLVEAEDERKLSAADINRLQGLVMDQREFSRLSNSLTRQRITSFLSNGPMLDWSRTSRKSGSPCLSNRWRTTRTADRAYNGESLAAGQVMVRTIWYARVLLHPDRFG